MIRARVGVRFVPRASPLEPIAAAAPRSTWPRLLEAWRARDEWDAWPKAEDGAPVAIRAAVTPAFLIVLGPGDALPWVDGVAYLGRDDRAPRLLVPTAVEPDVPLALLERALFARHAAASVPAALLLDPMRLIDLSRAAPFDRAALERRIQADG